VIALSPLAKQIVYPPIMLMQLVPKIAVAPLFLIWLGFGIESKVLLTILMTFFPLLPREHQRLPDPRRPLPVPDALDGRDVVADVPLPALPGGAAGDLLGHQDVRDDRGDRRRSSPSSSAPTRGWATCCCAAPARWTSSSCSRCSWC
jgi:hypothetical protein